MSRISFEKIVKANRTKIFELATNYEDFGKTLPQYFPSIRVRSKRDNVAVVEEHMRIGGKELVMMTKHVIHYPDVHEVFVIGGDAKGSHIIEKYEVVHDGTKITVDANFKLLKLIKIAGFFGKRKLRDGLERIMEDFVKIAEN